MSLLRASSSYGHSETVGHRVTSAQIRSAGARVAHRTANGSKLPFHPLLLPSITTTVAAAIVVSAIRRYGSLLPPSPSWAQKQEVHYLKISQRKLQKCSSS